jgi:hypothetical protein
MGEKARQSDPHSLVHRPAKHYWVCKRDHKTSSDKDGKRPVIATAAGTYQINLET